MPAVSPGRRSDGRGQGGEEHRERAHPKVRERARGRANAGIGQAGLGRWRRGRDSNPRCFRTPLFESGTINHSDTSPRERIPNRGRCTPAIGPLSRPLADRGSMAAGVAPLLSFRGRARRGTSGALYLQSAPAGLNPLPRSPLPNAARRRDVEDRVPRSGEPRTVSDPEGSSTKRSSPGAAERPGPSRPSWWARGRSARRRVHGISTLAGHARR